MARVVSPIDGDVVRPGGLLIVPLLSVMAASLVQTLPFTASAPTLPPIAFMLFISWRLIRSDLLPAWSAILLGFWDDVFSGQAIGSAVATWTLCALALDAIDDRLVWRDFRIDWLLGAAAIIIVLVGGAVLARAGDAADVARLVGPQCVWSILLLPVAMRIAATLDRWRIGA